MTASNSEIPDFDEGSETVKWFAMAKRYMMAARTLRLSADYAAGRALFVPTLHVTAQGIEVLLKANLIGSGLVAKEVKAIGHDIWRLWEHPKNQLLREQALIEATTVYERAKTEKPEMRYFDTFEADPQALLLEYIKGLSVLHTRESDFALRYVSDLASEGPRPHLLAETFFEVADLCIRQPTALLIR
ncbi:hypothetical protein [Rhizobium leguminosarum]|uniref:hypothetical protein n=1 Tax=Rhizobium leguminosarum TaxID=384 RepID=UPI0010317B15|nr:hypothetical protein [Rhizobium leguminosarum]TAW50612.1 hypothetical protein ELI14_04145 [Rhizobium leguminosarum]